MEFFFCSIHILYYVEVLEMLGEKQALVTTVIVRRKRARLVT